MKKCWVEERNYNHIELQTLNFKEIDACVIMYIIYILDSVLWVFAYSMDGFDYFIHVLNISFKIWAD